MAKAYTPAILLLVDKKVLRDLYARDIIIAIDIIKEDPTIN
jgi:hypothetical protein